MQVIYIRRTLMKCLISLFCFVLLCLVMIFLNGETTFFNVKEVAVERRSQLNEDAYPAKDKQSIIVQNIREELKNKFQRHLADLKENIGNDISQLKEKVSILNKFNENNMMTEELQQIYEKIDDTLLAIGIKPSKGEKVELKEEVPNTVVCPEPYTNSTYGYPFFYKGWEMKHCSNVPKFSEVLSITLNFRNKETVVPQEKIIYILKAIEQSHPELKIHIAGSDELPKSVLDGLNLNIKYYDKELEKKKSGEIWNFLINKVDTPYTLVAPDLVHFLGMDARLERLVREINALDAKVVGAASRDFQGHWSINCLQMNLKNYSLSYTQGYHTSKHECVFCDVITGPFVAKTKFLKTTPFHGSFDEDILFHDFFISHFSKSSKRAVCPDSMFYVGKELNLNPDKNKWLPLAKKHQLVTINLSKDKKMKFSCREVELFCNKNKGTALDPCCLQEIADMVKFFMKTCESNKLICELQEGTLLGAVKFGKVLPWERDADLTFSSANFTALKSLESHFRQGGYSFSTGSELWCCVDGKKAGGTGMLRSSSWHTELYGQHWMDTEKLLDVGLPPTKVLFDNMWVAVPRNPGLYVRNRYGHEIYKHVQHWMTIGHSTGWDLYRPSKFSSCVHPGKHYCLDQYSVDGSIQFNDYF